MTAVSVDEAASQLAQGVEGPVRERAAAALLEAARQAAARIVKGGSALQADIAQDAWITLHQAFRRGRVPDDVGAYVYRAVRNRYISHLRTLKSSVDTTERLAALTSDPEQRALDDETDLVWQDRSERVWSILDRVAEHAIARRKPAHRRHLEQAWREMKGMFRDEKAQAEVLAAEGELDEGSLEAAEARLHTRHRRARGEMRSALQALEATGELIAEDARVAGEALAHLVRRTTT